MIRKLSVPIYHWLVTHKIHSLAWKIEKYYIQKDAKKGKTCKNLRIMMGIGPWKSL